MKKITAAVLGLTMALATAGMTFAAQDTNAKGTAATPSTPAKKHVKKHSSKKAAKPEGAPSASATPTK